MNGHLISELAWFFIGGYGLQMGSKFTQAKYTCVDISLSLIRASLCTHLIFVLHGNKITVDSNTKNTEGCGTLICNQMPLLCPKVLVLPCLSLLITWPVQLNFWSPTYHQPIFDDFHICIILMYQIMGLIVGSPWAILMHGNTWKPPSISSLISSLTSIENSSVILS